MSYFPTPPHPFREVLAALTGVEPPYFVRGYNADGLTDEQMTQLQDWCSEHVKPNWATGLSLIEAAELIVSGAVENNNIEQAEDVAK